MGDLERIGDFLEKNRGEMVDCLMELVRIPSVSNDRPEVVRALHFALNLARELGFSAKPVLEDQVGVIEFGEGKEILGILSHVDVVPAGDEAAWSIPPFAPEVRDGAVWGRGTLDDKGAIIASLYALKAVASLEQPFCKKVQIILGTQEEIKWTDMEAYVKVFPLPDYGFTPDGEFPLCNIEKGIGGVKLSFDLRSAPEEPEKRKNQYTLLGIEAGIAENMIPGSAAAKLLWHGTDGRLEKELTLSASGVSVHACMPEKGENAIVNLCRVLAGMPLTENGGHALATLVAEKLGDTFCGSIGLSGRSEYYNGEYVHVNCMSPTVIRMQGSKAHIHMDLRIACGTAPEEIVAGFEDLMRTAGGEVCSNSLVPATYIDRNLPFMQAFSEAYDAASGFENEFALAYGGSYAKAMPNVASWGPIFPGEEDTCHEENEYITIDSMVKAAKIYGEAIRRIALSPDSFR